MYHNSNLQNRTNIYEPPAPPGRYNLTKDEGSRRYNNNNNNGVVDVVDVDDVIVRSASHPNPYHSTANNNNYNNNNNNHYLDHYEEDSTTTATTTAEVNYQNNNNMNNRIVLPPTPRSLHNENNYARRTPPSGSNSRRGYYDNVVDVYTPEERSRSREKNNNNFSRSSSSTTTTAEEEENDEYLIQSVAPVGYVSRGSVSQRGGEPGEGGLVQSLPRGSHPPSLSTINNPNNNEYNVATSRYYPPMPSQQTNVEPTAPPPPPAAVYSEPNNNKNKGGKKKKDKHSKSEFNQGPQSSPPPPTPFNTEPRQGNMTGTIANNNNLNINNNYYSNNNNPNNANNNNNNNVRSSEAEVLVYASPYLDPNLLYSRVTPLGLNSHRRYEEQEDGNRIAPTTTFLGAWGTSARTAVCQLQGGTCCLGCLPCGLPFLLLKQRKTLLFHDLPSRYVCCGGTVPCCIPPPEVRPELYTSADPSSLIDSVDGAYAKEKGAMIGYKHTAVPGRDVVNTRGEGNISMLVNKHNGLPQYGCYRASSPPRRHHRGPQEEVGGQDCECCGGLCLIRCPAHCCTCPRPQCCLGCLHPTNCTIGSCAPCCFCLELFCCMPCALQANRLLLRRHYQLPPDPCIDAGSGGCYNGCLGLLYGCYCCCPSRLPVNPYQYPSQGGAGLQCARSVSSMCGACCLCCCAGCAMAQQKDHLERHGYPLPSTFAPPDITGMH